MDSEGPAVSEPKVAEPPEELSADWWLAEPLVADSSSGHCQSKEPWRGVTSPEGQLREGSRSVACGLASHCGDRCRGDLSHLEGDCESRRGDH